MRDDTYYFLLQECDVTMWGPIPELDWEERSYVQSPHRHSPVEVHTESISVSQPQRILLILAGSSQMQDTEHRWQCMMNESVQFQSVKTQTNKQNPATDSDPTANEINHLCTQDGSILVAVNLYRNNRLPWNHDHGHVIAMKMIHQSTIRYLIQLGTAVCECFRVSKWSLIKTNGHGL